MQKLQVISFYLTYKIWNYQFFLWVSAFESRLLSALTEIGFISCFLVRPSARVYPSVVLFVFVSLYLARCPHVCTFAHTHLSPFFRQQQPHDFLPGSSADSSNSALSCRGFLGQLKLSGSCRATLSERLLDWKYNTRHTYMGRRTHTHTHLRFRQT